MKYVDEFVKDPNPKNEEHVRIVQNYANELVLQFQFLPTFTKSEIVKLLDQHDPGIITINSVIASLQSHETIKVLNWLKGNKALGKPNDKYVIYNGMTMKFYHLEKPRNLKCTQCGDDVLREEIHVSASDSASKIIHTLKQRGYKENPDMVPFATLQEFNGIKEVDFDQTIRENEMRDFELVTMAGFVEGEIFITLRVSKE